MAGAVSTSEGGANTTAVLEIVAPPGADVGATAAPTGMRGAAVLALGAWRRVGAKASAADHPGHRVPGSGDMDDDIVNNELYDANAVGEEGIPAVALAVGPDSPAAALVLVDAEAF